jgi:hypothetical protein
VFDGGLTLKPGQTLVGRTEAGRLPAITNSTAERNGGNGIVLADSVRIWNVRVVDTHASGVRAASRKHDRTKRRSRDRDRRGEGDRRGAPQLLGIRQG